MGMSWRTLNRKGYQSYAPVRHHSEKHYLPPSHRTLATALPVTKTAPETSSNRRGSCYPPPRPSRLEGAWPGPSLGTRGSHRGCARGTSVNECFRLMNVFPQTHPPSIMRPLHPRTAAPPHQPTRPNPPSSLSSSQKFSWEPPRYVRPSPSGSLRPCTFSSILSQPVMATSASIPHRVPKRPISIPQQASPPEMPPPRDDWPLEPWMPVDPPSPQVVLRRFLNIQLVDNPGLEADGLWARIRSLRLNPLPRDQATLYAAMIGEWMYDGQALWHQSPVTLIGTRNLTTLSQQFYVQPLPTRMEVRPLICGRYLPLLGYFKARVQREGQREPIADMVFFVFPIKRGQNRVLWGGDFYQTFLRLMETRQP